MAKRTRRPAAAGSTASVEPIAPRVGDDLTEVTDPDRLIDDPQWSQLHVTADLTERRPDPALRRIDIEGCRLAGTRLASVDLEGGRLIDTVLVDCDLSGALLHGAALTRVHLVNCRLSGLVLDAARLRDVRFTDCRADQLSMRMAVAERVTFERVRLAAADLYQAQLSGCRLFDCDLTGAEVSNIALDDVRFHGSLLDGLRGVQHLRNATIDPLQRHAIAEALLVAHRIEVDDEREPVRP
jgi:uncharacterized protein YjbI with pentapeptide repeats